MAVATRPSGGYLERPRPSGLADVLEIILDKGIVIDAYVRVSLIGIEILTVDARIVIASVDTYLRFAEAVNRLDLTETETSGIPELMQDITHSGAKGKTTGAKYVAAFIEELAHNGPRPALPIASCSFYGAAGSCPVRPASGPRRCTSRRRTRR